MHYTFRFRFEREPDTGWTMTLSGEVQAETLEDAWLEVSNALGAGLWQSVCRNLAEDWTVAIVAPDGHTEPVYECEFCEGSGCSSCDARGFKYERWQAASDSVTAPAPVSGDVAGVTLRSFTPNARRQFERGDRLGGDAQ